MTQFKKNLLPVIFRFLPLWLWGLLLLGFAATVAALQHFGVKGAGAVPQPAVIGAAAAFGVILIVHFLGGSRLRPAAVAIAGNLVRTGRFLDTAAQKAELHYQKEQARIKSEFDTAINNINLEWRQATRRARTAQSAIEVDVRAAKIIQKNEKKHRARFEQLEKMRAENLHRIREQSNNEARRFFEAQAANMARLEADFQSGWQALETDWNNSIRSIYEKIQAANAEADKTFPAWDSAAWKDWTPPREFRNAAKFGRLEVELAKFAEMLPKDKRLALPGPVISVPLTLAFPLEGSILFETNKGGEAEAVAAINNIIFRLLSATPPGKVSFTIFDPVGLGQNFAALMHLADYEEGYINSRIWTQSAQFEEKLAELNEHMEKVIQMYLRNEYATIADYNAQAGSIAEKYHFLVIASFPVNFTDTAARRLRNIAANGARCGVYLLVHWDQRNARRQTISFRMKCEKIPRASSASRKIFNWPTGTSPARKSSSIPLPRRNSPRNFCMKSARAAKIPRASKSPSNRSHPPTAGFGARRPPKNCACRSVAPGRRNFSISRSAKARASMPSSPAKPGRANPPCSISSSPTSPCGAARTRSSFISWTSKRASSSNATPAAASAPRQSRGHRK